MKNFGFVALNDGSLAREPSGRARARGSRELRRDSPPERRRGAHSPRRAGAHARGQAALRAQGELRRGRGPLHARLSPSEEAPQHRVPAHDTAPAPAHEPLQRRLPRQERRRRGDTRVLPAARLRLRPHPDYNRQRLRGRGRDVRGSRPSTPRTRRGTRTAASDYSQDFFGKRATLTVSGQLNAENFAMAFGDVYTFGPTFRAEKSNTQRHAPSSG